MEKSSLEKRGLFLLINDFLPEERKMWREIPLNPPLVKGERVNSA